MHKNKTWPSPFRFNLLSINFQQIFFLKSQLLFITRCIYFITTKLFMLLKPIYKHV